MSDLIPERIERVRQAARERVFYAVAHCGEFMGALHHEHRDARECGAIQAALDLALELAAAVGAWENSAHEPSGWNVDGCGQTCKRCPATARLLTIVEQVEQEVR